MSSLSKYSILLIVLIGAIFYKIDDPLDSEYNWKVISFDVAGYYSYLPGYLIYDDPGLEHDFDGDKLIHYYGPQGSPGKPYATKYTMGLAYQYAPGFLISHWIIKTFTDYPPNTLSPPYHRALLYSGYLSFLIGLIFLRKVLLFFFSEKVTATLLVLYFIGTNLLTNVLFKAALPHVWLFTDVCILMWLAIRYSQSRKAHFLWMIGLLSGVIVLTRYTDALIIVTIGLAILWYNKEELRKQSFWIKGILPALFLFALVFVPQIYHWKTITGQYFYDGYYDEGFHWLDSKVWWGLFSSFKGWFIYSPIMLLVIPGFILLYQREKAAFHVLFWPFALTIYVIFAWWCWWYGGAYGCRPLIEWMPLLALPVGLTLEWMLKRTKVLILLTPLLAGACYHSLFMSHHYMIKTYHSDKCTFEVIEQLYIDGKRTQELIDAEGGLYRSKLPQ
ncbi:MAG: hypothetical protein EP346_06005 [Bacteroidetes bacterium]|nr:MAG: hypothetical protein EP346_06005 [Bacteroidota bacterium]